MEPIQEQYSETNISILSNDPDKIEKYNVLLQKVIPIAKSATLELEKRAAYDFIILLKSALNQSNNLVLIYLNDAIEYLIRYFSKDLQQLFNGSVDWENSFHNGYALLNDLTRFIMQSILHRQKLKEFRKFCLDI
jgi:hypothetical protein